MSSSQLPRDGSEIRGIILAITSSDPPPAIPSQPFARQNQRSKLSTPPDFQAAIAGMAGIIEGLVAKTAPRLTWRLKEAQLPLFFAPHSCALQTRQFPIIWIATS